MLERLRNEPAVLIIIAAGVIVLGVDLAALSEAVEKLLQLLVLAGSAATIRHQVTPVANPHDEQGRPLTPDL